jgi:hypothetical protein
VQLSVERGESLMKKSTIASAVLGLVLAGCLPAMADINQLGQPQGGTSFGFNQGDSNWKSDGRAQVGWMQEYGIRIHKKCEDLMHPENCNPPGLQTSRQAER